MSEKQHHGARPAPPLPRTCAWRNRFAETREERKMREKGKRPIRDEEGWREREGGGRLLSITPSSRVVKDAPLPKPTPAKNDFLPLTDIWDPCFNKGLRPIVSDSFLMISAWAGAGRSLSVWFEISHGVAGDGLWPTEMSVREGVSVRMWGTRDIFYFDWALEIFGASDGAGRRAYDVHRNNGRRLRNLGVSSLTNKNIDL